MYQNQIGLAISLGIPPKFTPPQHIHYAFYSARRNPASQVFPDLSLRIFSMGFGRAAPQKNQPHPPGQLTSSFPVAAKPNLIFTIKPTRPQLVLVYRFPRTSQQSKLQPYNRLNNNVRCTSRWCGLLLSTRPAL